MRNWKIPVRITRTVRCPEGFYLIINGSRIHFRTKSAALASVDAFLSLQKIQIVSVREYAARNQKKIHLAMPKGGAR